MKKHSKILVLFLPMISTLSLPACSTNPVETRHGHLNVNIQSFDSSYAKIKSVKLNSHTHRTVISGEVQRTEGVRGPVFGHIDMQILSQTGGVVYQSTVRHKTSTVIPRLARFSLELPTNIEDNSIITVRHHFCGWGDKCED